MSIDWCVCYCFTYVPSVQLCMCRFYDGMIFVSRLICARLWYFQCICTGNNIVLHYPPKIIVMIFYRDLMKQASFVWHLQGKWCSQVIYMISLVHTFLSQMKITEQTRVTKLVYIGLVVNYPSWASWAMCTFWYFPWIFLKQFSIPPMPDN